jgi:hypothetical protein
MGNTVGEKESPTISEGALLRLNASHHRKTLTDGTGLSGKVQRLAASIARLDPVAVR